MKNHLLFKNVYEAFYKSKSEKIFQSVHQQSNFLEKSAIDINPILVPFFIFLTSSFFIPDLLTQEQEW